MKGTFDDSNSQVQRLMEALGGSADAYEPPSVDPVEAPASNSKKPNPFLDDSQPDHGLVVIDEPEGGSLGTPEGYQPGPGEGEEGFEKKSEPYPCVFGLAGLEDDDPPEFLPLDDSYIYHGLVEGCGELDRVWEAFHAASVDQLPKQAILDSGIYEVTRRPPLDYWVLEDPVKDRKYLLESGNLAGHLAPGEKFIWVTGLQDTDQDFGYIHCGAVFLKKP